MNEFWNHYGVKVVIMIIILILVEPILKLDNKWYNRKIYLTSKPASEMASLELDELCAVTAKLEAFSFIKLLLITNVASILLTDWPVNWPKVALQLGFSFMIATAFAAYKHQSTKEYYTRLRQGDNDGKFRD